MASAGEELKAQARILHRRATRQDPATLERLRAAGVTAEPIKRRHCLAAIARELGFAGWPDVVAALEGRADVDFGTTLYPPECSGHSNIWCASYDEARDIRAQRGDYLLVYKHDPSPSARCCWRPELAATVRANRWGRAEAYRPGPSTRR